MRKPTIYLDEIQERLYEHTDTAYSLNTTRNALIQLQYTPNFLRYMRDRAIEEEKKSFHWVISNIPPRVMVFVDECSVRKADPQNHENWPLKCPPEALRGIYIIGERYYLAAAFTLKGFVCSQIWKGEDGRRCDPAGFAGLILGDDLKPHLRNDGGEPRVLFVNDIHNRGGDSFVGFVTDFLGCGVIELPSCPSAL